MAVFELEKKFDSSWLCGATIQKRIETNRSSKILRNAIAATTAASPCHADCGPHLSCDYKLRCLAVTSNNHLLSLMVVGGTPPPAPPARPPSCEGGQNTGRGARREQA
jgi:hypothetical protein